MDPIVGGAIVSSAGSLLASGVGYGSARQQEKFQQTMSNTAHQREVRDLVAAGLNPILSAGGHGASTPTGTMFTPDNPAREAGQLMAQREDVKTRRVLARKELEKMDQEIVESQTRQGLNSGLAAKAANEAMIEAKRLELMDWEMANMAALNKKMLTETGVSSAQAQKIRAETGLLGEHMPEAKAKGDVYRTPYGKGLTYVGETLQKVLGAIPFLNLGYRAATAGQVLQETTQEDYFKNKDGYTKERTVRHKRGR